MMFLMRPDRRLSFSVLLALLSALTTGPSVVNATDPATFPAWTIISRFIAVLFYSVFGLTVARAINLTGSMVVAGKDWRFSIRELFTYGIVPGAVLGIVNYYFFFTYRLTLYVPPQAREIKNTFDSLILALNTGLVEETIFRLFLLSCLVLAFTHLYARLKLRWPSLVGFLPIALSLVLSSLLFAMVHGYYSFTAAFFGGMLLGAIYLKSGIEAAIAAHVVANFLFFTASYL